MAEDKKEKENNKKWEDKKVKITVDIEKLNHVQGNDFFMLVSTTLTQGGKPLGGRTVKIFVDGIESVPLVTDYDHGRVAEEINFSSDDKRVLVQARQVGFDLISPRISQLLPRPEKKREEKPIEAEAAEFIVDPTRVGNKITLLARVIDEKGKGVKEVQLSFVENSKVAHLKTDDYGNYCHSFILGEEEEREIAIYADGFAEEFRRTFKGRRI